MTTSNGFASGADTVVRQSATPPPVMLIQMPFAFEAWPSLGLSLLKAGLLARGIEAQILYFNLAFFDFLGPEIYEGVAKANPRDLPLLGEWVFTEALWGADPRRDAEFMATLRSQNDVDEAFVTRHKNYAVAARASVAQFLTYCLSHVAWQNVKIVGFTSTFQQHLASLTLAKLLKQSFPHLVIVFGGANCEGEMGAATLRNFPFIDAVCSGEGDNVFPEFAAQVLAGKARSIPGFLTRPGFTTDNAFSIVGVSKESPSHAPPVEDMDSLPYPDFSDFFDALKDTPYSGSLPVRMMFESSRGCWWGQKHHCTFCGLNGMGMQFRQKSPSRAIAEILHLVDKYGAFTKRFAATDNIIPIAYFRSFLPQLEELHLDLDLFYETKANLTEEQLTQYRRAGLKQIQPGIESLSTPVLTLMRKGVSALQNIQLLVWCAKHNVTVFWSYLFGFPGEDPASYEGQAALIDKLVHLQAPLSCGSVRFDRFSPYHSEPSSFGISEIQPYPAYQHIYCGVPASEIPKLAYYFVGEFPGKNSVPSYTGSIVDSIKQWQARANHVSLCHMNVGDRVLVFDHRDPDSLSMIVLTGLAASIFHKCSSITAGRQLISHAGQEGYEPAKITAAIDKLVALNLLIEEQQRFLSLSIPLGHGYGLPRFIRQELKQRIPSGTIDVNSDELRIPLEMCTVL
jgi:ribosomal peptide maturation radical SAM protein 1